MSDGSAAGATQRRVRETMLAAGGYWRPLAAVARLLEELGELAELLGAHSADPAELASELADLWIITAALGDQFLAALGEPGDEAARGGGDGETPRPSAAAPAALALLAAAGPIARVVNYYDGPKTPRDAAVLPPLRSAVPAFHDALARLASMLGIELASAVSAKLDAIGASADMRRFARDRSDPSTAPSLEQLRASAERQALAAGWPRRLWGAPALADGDAHASAALLAPSLRSFVRAAAHERLAGYVLAARAPSEIWLGALLRALDPDARPGSEVGGFAFEGVHLQVSTLQRAPWTFVLLTPAKTARAH